MFTTSLLVFNIFMFINIAALLHVYFRYILLNIFVTCVLNIFYYKFIKRRCPDFFRRSLKILFRSLKVLDNHSVILVRTLLCTKHSVCQYSIGKQCCLTFGFFTVQRVSDINDSFEFCHGKALIHYILKCSFLFIYRIVILNKKVI